MVKMKPTRRTGLLILGLTVMGFIGYGFLSSGLFAGTEKQELEKLFSDMGVLQVPDVADPVEIVLEDPYGLQIRLSDFRGKIVFINFWTTWCLACVIEMPSMEKLHQKFKDKDFAMVTINLQESAATVINFFKKYNLTFTTLLDTTGDVGAAFGIRAIPTTFILDKNGRLIGKVLGPREWDSKSSFALFEHLLGGDVAGST